MEILVAQNEVYNGYRSTRTHSVTNPFGGEFTFLGRRGAWNDRSPQDTLLELLTEIGFSIPTGGFRSLLFDRNKGASSDGRTYDIYNFLALESENDWLRGSIETINSHFQQKRRKRDKMISNGTFWDLLDGEKRLYSPKYHELTWVTIQELLHMINRPYANKYQREQFQKWGVTQRWSIPATISTLKNVLLFTLQYFVWHDCAHKCCCVRCSAAALWLVFGCCRCRCRRP